MSAGFEGKGRINREDWALTWNAALETGGLLVSDRIELEFDVSAIKLTPVRLREKTEERTEAGTWPAPRRPGRR